jgi:hypothetical protein
MKKTRIALLPYWICWTGWRAVILDPIFDPGTRQWPTCHSKNCACRLAFLCWSPACVSLGNLLQSVATNAVDRGRFWLRKVPLAFQCLMLTPLLLHIYTVYVYGLAPVVGLAEYGEFRRLRGKLGLGAAALGGSTPYQWVMRHGL